MADNITTSGPIFDRRAEAAFRSYSKSLQETLADEARDNVIAFFGKFVKNPTGTYVSKIRTEQRGNLHLVSDSGIVYGPWLAGVSSRNQKTRFKGYKHWRLAAQKTDRNAERIAEHTLQPTLRRVS